MSAISIKWININTYPRYANLWRLTHALRLIFLPILINEVINKGIIIKNANTPASLSIASKNPKYAKFNAGLSVYKKKIEGELYDQCMEIVNIVKDSCVGAA